MRRDRRRRARRGRATARLYIIAFIRWKLPAGGPDAYTAAELAALNAQRQSKQPFAPYATE
ncbi:MAG: hypothetical protein JO257_37410 [Deltaproteobacteria bacterium]|nr:hypothetical protein [Deltaproteobacteria bacterium]